MNKDLPLRLIDAGKVPYLRSQTIYHALAYAQKKNSIDTIVLDIPASPYVCIGFHRDLEQEVDIDFCNKNNIPIIRRETGGGTVYIDENQLFVQWIFEPEHLPRKVDARFELFIQPLVETYRHFGINARFCPPNDVHVKGKKIVGTGAAAIGKAEVVTGNFLFDFDNQRMAEVVKVPSLSFRKTTLDSLEKYMTSINRELDNPSGIDEVKKVYIEKCAAVLGRKIVPGDFTKEEYEMMEVLDKKFTTKEWLYHFQTKGNGSKLLKIHANVWLYENVYQVQENCIRISLRTKGKRIDKINFSGDFEFEPRHRLKGLENVLRNVELSEEPIREVVEAFYKLHHLASAKVKSQDWVNAILEIKKSHSTAPFAK